MATTAFFCEDNGASTAGVNGNRGTTRTTGVTNVNWKSVDDVASAYSSNSINAGENSYEKFQFVAFSGAFNQISNVKWHHVSGTLGAGLTIKGGISGSGIYTTPSQTANAALTLDLTAIGSISTGFAITVGPSGAEAGGKASTSSSVPSYTQYLITQLQTTAAAAAGDTATVTFQVRFDEN
jgi:hypothetical protein